MSAPTGPKPHEYRPKTPPLGVVTAIRYEGAFRGELAKFLGDRYGFEAPFLLIRGDEDDHRVPVGNWIIRDARGEFYDSPDENFRAWYEPCDTALREALDEIWVMCDDRPGLQFAVEVRDVAMRALGER